MSTFAGILALLLWSSLALLAAISNSFPPFLLLATSFSIAFFISIAWRKKTSGKWFAKPNLRQSQWLLGIYGLFGYHFCYFFSIQYAPVLEVSLINYLWPLLLSLFLAKKERRIFALLGGIIAFLGVVTLLSGEKTQFNNQHLLGYGLALTAAFIWASYSAMLTKRNCELGDIGWISLAVAVLSFTCHMLFEFKGFHLAQYSYAIFDIFIVLLIGLGPLGSAFYLWELGLSKGKSQLLASLSFFTPVFSSALLALFGLAIWSFDMLVALTLILVGGGITHLKIKLG